MESRYRASRRAPRATRRPGPRAGAALGLLAAAALAATGARAARDCLEPLQEHAKWACRAELSDGQSVEYCVEHNHTFGAEPASRFFRTTSTGLYRASCTCQAKGGASGGFGQDAAYLCLDRETDTVIRGKASKAKLAGETYNVTANVRSAFSCVPDPGCDVPSVVDRELPAQHGHLKLLGGPQVGFPFVGAGGDVSIAYLPGCNGYTSEAPSFVVEVDSTNQDAVEAFVSEEPQLPDKEGILVVGPSGEAQCADGHAVATVPIQHGRVGVWLVTKSPSARIDGEVRVRHD